MYVQKRSSGNYRARQMINGKVYSFTFDHKPTKSEFLQRVKDSSLSPINGTCSVERACESYIESKSNVLSPSTIRGYYSILKQLSPSFRVRSLQTVTLPVLQTEVNRYSAEHSAKSTRNFSGFLQSVIKFYGGGTMEVTLPMKEKKSEYIPSAEDVKRIFAEVKGTRYEVPLSLAALGLRRSEICALELSDLNGCELTINKAVVLNKNQEWTVKPTKTTDSTRTIFIPSDLADRIREQGYIYEGDPEMIYCALVKAQKKLGIPHFSLHKMRHFFASYLHDLGYSDKQIQEMGGWRTDIIMKSVYQHAMDMEQAKKNAADNIGSLF